MTWPPTDALKPLEKAAPEGRVAAPDLVAVELGEQVVAAELLEAGGARRGARETLVLGRRVETLAAGGVPGMNMEGVRPLCFFR